MATKATKTIGVRDIRCALMMAMLPAVPFDGWALATAQQAGISCGYDKNIVRAVFPGGLTEVVDYFSAYADDLMMAALEPADPGQMRVRDRIRLAVMTRFEVLRPHREAQRLALSYWGVPTRSLRAGRIVWRTADRIWDWAGDTATDYNRYTKRTLLAGVLASATLVFTGDDTPDLAVTGAFVDRRIENVMQLGRILGKIRKTA